MPRAFFWSLVAPTAIVASVMLAGCGPQIGSMDPGRMLGFDLIAGQPSPILAGIGQKPGPTTLPLPPIGDSCSRSGGICLALKYVTYLDPSIDAPIVDRASAIANVRSINTLWGQCEIGFQIEQYQAVRPEAHGLNFATQSLDELERIREAFADNGELLVVTTGRWERSGSLGNTAANAWTTMPGGGTHGVVLEEPVAGFSNIIGHELGHYLSLLHVRDEHALMNPVIYSGSMGLSAEQCSIVRSAASFFWPRMYR